MKGSTLLSGSFVFLALVAAGCGGADDATGTPVTNFAGEYTYVITGAGGTCVDLPRASGGGVLRVTQTQAWVVSCFTRDLCDGETCAEGPASGDAFTVEGSFTHTVDGCEHRESYEITTTRGDAGVLFRRHDNHLAYVSGDCSAMVLPCEYWQTSVATPCDTPCYEGYCATLRSQGARDARGM